MKFRKLRGRIVEMYGSQRAFAQAVGITVQTVSAKLAGKRAFTIDDISKWCEMLIIDVSEIPDYFFAT